MISEGRAIDHHINRCQGSNSLATVDRDVIRNLKMVSSLAKLDKLPRACAFWHENDGDVPQFVVHVVHMTDCGAMYHKNCGTRTRSQSGKK